MTKVFLNLGFEKNKENYYFINKFFFSKSKAHRSHSFDLLITNESNLEKINNEVNELFPKIMKTLTKILNKINKIKFTNKQYNFLIGFYVFSVLRMILGRKEKLKKIFLKNKNIRISSEDLRNINPDIYDTLDLHRYVNYNLVQNRLINFTINFYLIIFYFKKKIFFFKKKKNLNFIEYRKSITKLSLLYLLLNIVIQFFSRFSKILIFSPFITSLSNIKLQLLFFQFPFFNKKTHIVKNIDYDLNKRLSTIKTIKLNDLKEEVILKILIALIPKCYIEDFQDLKKDTEALKWNKKPKYIFTSNDYFYNELFKMFCALNPKNKIIIGQHGTNFFISKFKFDPAFEQIFYHRLISWGAIGRKTIRGFNFVKNDIKHFPFKNAQQILIVFNGFRGETLYDESYDYFDYIDYYYNLIKKIPIEIRKKIVVKFHKNEGCFLNEKKIFHKILNKSQILSNDQNLSENINKSLVTIFTYDNTDFYKCLNIHRPVLLFSHNGLAHVQNRHKKTFELLKFANIYLENDQNKLINLISELSYNKIYKMWSDLVVTKCIVSFNSKINRQSNNKIFELYNLINKT
jgi:putative transferase (TIGR04331 family)